MYISLSVSLSLSLYIYLYIYTHMCKRIPVIAIITHATM